MRTVLSSFASTLLIISACNLKSIEVDLSEREKKTEKHKQAPDNESSDFVISPDDKASYIFDDSELRTYELLIDPKDLDKINADPTAEQYVEGALTFEGETYEPVGIRYKGSVGSFFACTESPALGMIGGGAKTCVKLSMKVKFNWLSDQEARFFGLKKLQFHSMIKDPSMMRERLGYALFNQMNVPAPRVVHAKLYINGRLEGLFALVEQIDGRFTRSRFTEGGKGNLYKEIWPIHDDPNAYLNALETNTQENPSVEKTLAFKAAIEGDRADEQIFDRLDLEYQMRYIAVDRTILNDDGIFHWYCSPRGQGRNPGGLGNHNYYWYEATDEERFWLIPWDLDLTFRGGNRAVIPIAFEWNDPDSIQTCGSGEANLSIRQQPSFCDKLTQLWASEQKQYKSAVRNFLEGPFSDSNVSEQIERWANQIDDAVREQSEATHNGTHISYSEWQQQLNALLQIIDELRSEAEARIQ